MNRDMRIGYIMCSQRLNEEIDIISDKIHNDYMNSNDEDIKIRLDAQMKILWNFKDKIENAIIDIYTQQEGKDDEES